MRVERKLQREDEFEMQEDLANDQFEQYLYLLLLLVVDLFVVSKKSVSKFLVSKHWQKRDVIVKVDEVYAQSLLKLLPVDQHQKYPNCRVQEQHPTISVFSLSNYLLKKV
jgi:hypothetical protein